MTDSDHISGLMRAVIGGLGGVAAAGAKYLGQDHPYYLRMLDLGDQAKIDNLCQGYYVMVPILILVGAIIAWAANENSRMKLLTMAISAPAIITTLAGGETHATKWALDLLSTPAYAQVQTADQTTSRGSLLDGVRLWFGIGKEDQRYRVVIGSFKDEIAAKAKADQVNKQFPDLKAFVGERRLFNDYYPVVVGGFSSYPQAKALKESVAEKTGIEDVYLSPRT